MRRSEFLAEKKLFQPATGNLAAIHFPKKKILQTSFEGQFNRRVVLLPSCAIEFAVYDHSSAFSSISIAYLNTTAIKCAFLIRGDEIDNPLNRSVLRNYVFGRRFISHFSSPVPLDFVFLAFALLFHSIPSRRVCFFSTKPPHSAF